MRGCTTGTCFVQKFCLLPFQSPAAFASSFHLRIRYLRLQDKEEKEEMLDEGYMGGSSAPKVVVVWAARSGSSWDVCGYGDDYCWGWWTMTTSGGFVVGCDVPNQIMWSFGSSFFIVEGQLSVLSLAIVNFDFYYVIIGFNCSGDKDKVAVS
ncbi:hypothetical protein QVD17_39614 [Tagetes erecta]|uniref:Uncharacterized protein n=1 Tax=Tagetes erecta TaxID=13708 RepID=A0AAD8NAB6_TARER|nr:hypothetical protein QVD17_39614 [Tagetes erecta]